MSVGTLLTSYAAFLSCAGGRLVNTRQRSVEPVQAGTSCPARTLPYRAIAEHFETWLQLAIGGQFDVQGDHRTPAPDVDSVFRNHPEVIIFAAP